MDESRLMKRLLVILVACLTLAACGGGSSKLGAAKPIQVGGKMKLVGVGAFRDLNGQTGTTGDQCEGSGGYSDMADGAEVVISDDSGKTLQITQLEPGSIGDSGESCYFAFNTTVPAGDKFYGITISHRGTVKFAEADVAAPVLTIGS
jgi:hypothetical protein